MTTLIAIYLLLTAVDSGIRSSQEIEIQKKIIHFILMLINIWYGVWMLTNL
jgi:hypothetical protein